MFCEFTFRMLNSRYTDKMILRCWNHTFCVALCRIVEDRPNISEYSEWSHLLVHRIEPIVRKTFSEHSNSVAGRIYATKGGA